MAWDDDFEKLDKGPRGNLFRKNRLPSDFNVEVEGFDDEVVKYFTFQIQENGLKCLYSSFKIH
jgi:hypothetical protein